MTIILVDRNVSFRNKIGLPTIFGSGAPLFGNNFSGNFLPLSSKLPGQQETAAGD